MSAADPVDLVLSRLQNVKTNGRGGVRRCPVAGCTYRLNVTPGDDHRALVACHGGHRAEEVVGSLGLTLGDLFVPTAASRGEGGFIPLRSTAQHRNSPA